MLEIKPTERARVQFNLNGREVVGWAEPRMLLSDFLRQEIGATGTHVGCEHGVCGCCTVMLDGKACRSCLTLAVQADGQRVQTVESLAADGELLNALQAAFHKHHALQCGFCTPGILMSCTELLNRTATPSEPEILDVLGGHICRCTGYAGIVAAVKDVAGRLGSERAAAGDAPPAT